MKPINGPQVSVIMPCHNGARYLRQSAESVLRQSFTDLELLIIDNNSTDGSTELIRSLAEADPRIVPLQCAAPGAAFARNTGIVRAKGRYIAFLDCDDYWAPEKLSRQVGAMQGTGAAFCWSSYRIVGADGQHLRDQIASPTTSYEAHMTKRSVIGCLTAVYDTDLVGKLLMPEIRMRQDYALWAQVIRKSESLGHPMVGLPEILATYRVHPSAMTRNKVTAARYQWNVYRNIEGHSFATSLRYFYHYVANALADRR